jgi:hypothetical protein
MEKQTGRMIRGALLLLAFLICAVLPAEEAKITVLNPRGTQPPIRLIPMAPRLDTLDGKTIYIVHVAFGDTFLPETVKVLSERFPKTNWVFKRKAGSYFDDDPKLWAEIKEKANGMIMGVGH